MREIEEVTRLREFMEEYEASTEHVAQNMGVSPKIVAEWLSGKSEPDGWILEKLSDYLAWVYPEEGEEPVFKGVGPNPGGEKCKK